MLLDEPTRGIDIGAKAEVHRLIAELAAAGVARARLAAGVGGAGLTVATMPAPDRRKVSGPPLVLCRYQKLEV